MGQGDYQFEIYRLMRQENGSVHLSHHQIWNKLVCHVTGVSPGCKEPFHNASLGITHSHIKGRICRITVNNRLHINLTWA